jgi:hypothetical protein
MAAMSGVEDAPPIVDSPVAPAQAEARRAIETSIDQWEALLAFARVDFWCFVELMFPVLYPGQKLIYAPYLELIATLLMRVARGKYRNVIINLPPRHMKSALTSILYTAWRLGCDPTVKLICISYGDDLAHDLSSQARKIMRSPLYKRIFPGTTLDKSAVDHIRTTLGGYRYATAVGSDITGFGADEIIIDDPIQPEEALSERVKQQVRDWVASSALTRFNNPSKCAVVLVMHRLASDDLSATNGARRRLSPQAAAYCGNFGKIHVSGQNDHAAGTGRAAQSCPHVQGGVREAAIEHSRPRVQTSISAATDGR